MSENRCERCNRKLKDPNAQYGWRCAEILGVSEGLNYSGDSVFDRYISGISAADNFLLERDIDKNNIHQASFYEAMAKRYISADMHNHDLWKDAYIQSENALKGISSGNRIPLSEYFDLRDAYDYKNGAYQTIKYLDGEYSQDTKKLQRALNEIGIKDKFGNKLKEDGLNGPKTQWARDMLFKGVSPSLSYISPLQSKITDIGIRKLYKNKLNDAIKMGKSGDALYFSGDQLYNTAIKRSRLLQFDYHYLKGAPQGTKDFHINAEADDVASELQKATAKFLNHKKIPETAYNTFKDFDNVEKYVKVGGKALTIAGFVFDAYDFGTSVYTDLNDEDRKLGKTTVSSAAGIAGSWAGGAAGAKLGAMGGAAVGSFICPGLGTAIGGFLGGLGGGIVGSVAGRKVGEVIVDEAYKEDSKKYVYQ